jgi:hypothetical protein
LKAELGYTHDVEWCVFTEDAGLVVGEKWQGYMLENLGIVLGRFSEWRIPDESIDFYERIGAITRTSENRVLLKPSLLFPFTCIPSPEDSDLIIKLCRIRARYEGSPLYSEMRAHPYGVRRVAIHGLQYKHTEKDFERAVKGLDLLRKADRKLRGRPKGSTKPEEVKAQEAAEFDRKIEETIRALLASEGKMPIKTAVAKALRVGGVSAATGNNTSLNALNSKLKRLEVDYNAIVERVKLNK